MCLSREWNDKDRQGLVEWFLQSRKNRWDIYLIIQDESLLDKQLRLAIMEHVVRCSRTDRFSLLGVKLPRVHIAKVYYGRGLSKMVVKRWWYKGTEIQDGYDTEQVFMDRTVDTPGPYSYLSPWHFYGRYSQPLGLGGILARVVYFLLMRFFQCLGLLPDPMPQRRGPSGSRRLRPETLPLLRRQAAFARLSSVATSRTVSG